MTIQRRKLDYLPWKVPFNTRELKPGESVIVAQLVEGPNIYELTALDDDTARFKTIVSSTVMGDMRYEKTQEFSGKVSRSINSTADRETALAECHPSQCLGQNTSDHGGSTRIRTGVWMKPAVCYWLTMDLTVYFNNPTDKR
jgi:hypothetical protein